MNIASRFETALKNTIAEYANGVPSMWIRTSYDNCDIRNMSASELFPQVFVQVSNPYTETEGVTWAVDFQLSAATFFEDDVQAHTVSDISGEVERIVFGLVNSSDAAIVTFFTGELARELGGVCFGGVTLSNGGYLTVTDGALVSTTSGTIHFAR